METIKTILVDSLNGFSPKYIPLFIFQLLTAGFLGYLVQRFVNRKFDSNIIRNGTLIALGIAVITAITKNSLPFSVLAAAAILMLAMSSPRDKNAAVGLFVLAVIGVGCGVGSVVQTVIGTFLLLMVLLFMPLKDEVDQA